MRGWLVIIKSKKLLLTILTLMLFLLSSCQTNNVKEEPYDGVPLKIAVVGEQPNVREGQINFNELSLSELRNSNLRKYDAVFIMEDHLSDASNSKYVEVYKNKNVPFFFVGSQANTIPFQDLENPVSYEVEAEKVNGTQNSISGILYEGEEKGYRGWKFAYPIKNSEVQRDNVKGIYSQVFKVVEKEVNKNS
ncbi:hypothetical protein [Guptibacillus hwajinpoensis]|uniref:hypothetical protein n=1 Tax=Guptibacillus hwajinpoensis TaxID=208199 RepID=UPI0024B380BE|nr:hypothetical protein [Pseudalkalibacillus hwajinpoensis]